MGVLPRTVAAFSINMFRTIHVQSVNRGSTYSRTSDNIEVVFTPHKMPFPLFESRIKRVEPVDLSVDHVYVF